jgi:hypothetical protein
VNQKIATSHDTFQLNELVQQVHSRADFIKFLGALRDHLERKPEEWENRDLASFLNALAAWVEDMDGYYQNLGESVPDQPSWKTMGQILLAARVYE